MTLAADVHWTASGLLAGRQAVHVMLGNISILMGRLDDALNHQKAAAELAVLIGDRKAWATAVFNQAIALRDVGRWDDAVAALQEQLKDDSPLDHGQQPAKSSSVLGEILLRRGRIREAVAALRRSVDESGGGPQTNSVCLDALMNLGIALHKQGEHVAALDVCSRAERGAASCGDAFLVSDVLWRKAELLLDMGEMA